MMVHAVDTLSLIGRSAHHSMAAAAAPTTLGLVRAQPFGLSDGRARRSEWFECLPSRCRPGYVRLDYPGSHESFR